MNPTEKELRLIKLLPHQAALLETFFSPASKRIILLRSDVGLGRRAALVALVRRLLGERPGARVLFLVPSALRSQFVEMLRDAGTPSLLVDRYRFREMLDSTSGGEFWPRGAVAILSLDFAKQPDIRESLAGARWDLVIADEAHSIRGARAEVLRKVGACAERVVLATATSHGLEPSDVFPAEEATVVEWRRDQLVDLDGKPLYAALRPILHEIPFSLNAAELTLRTTVGGLCEILGGATGVQSFMSMVLLRSLESSPAAIEGALRRLSVRLGATADFEGLIETPEEEVSEDRMAEGMNPFIIAEKAAEIAARALQEIEAMGSDSKLGAFDRLLSDLSDAKIPFRRICVLTQFVGTLYYLAAEIEGRGMAFQLLHGGMGAEDRLRSLTLFSNAGGILLATSAVMAEGLSLAEVTDLILYDIPGSKNALQQVLGRFDRFDRLSQLNVHVLVPSNSSDDLILAPIGLLRNLIAVEAKP